MIKTEEGKVVIFDLHGWPSGKFNLIRKLDSDRVPHFAQVYADDGNGCIVWKVCKNDVGSGFAELQCIRRGEVLKRQIFETC